MMQNVSLSSSIFMFLSLNAFCISQVIAYSPPPLPVVLPEVCQQQGSCSPDIALVDTALHSVQQDIHQMRHTINFTKRHACVPEDKTNLTDSATSATCLKANILMNLLQEAEEVAESLDLDTYYFHRQRFSPREVASLLLQGLGLLGATIFFGYLAYYAVGSLFVTGVLLVDILMDLPSIFAKAMFIPFFLIAAEIFIFGYFIVGSFSLLLVLASVVESCSFIFAHNPLVLECLGMATIVTAMLSLSTPVGASTCNVIDDRDAPGTQEVVCGQVKFADVAEDNDDDGNKNGDENEGEDEHQ